jgi:serine/threonine-protein kinase
LLYEFGPFTVQPDERLLLREGRLVSLPPKAFDLLVHLIEKPGQLVGKQQLMTALWPDTFVEETNLAYTMSALRRALGDGQNDNQYIQTVPTRGYRFVAPVTQRESAATITDDRIAQGIGRRRRFSVLAVAAVVIAILGGLLLVRWAPSKDTASATPLHLSTELGVHAGLPATDAPFALSADGTLLAFVARVGEAETQLYIRHLDQPTATPIPGTEGASTPFFSPDGQRVAFFADLMLKVVPVAGGAVVPLAEAQNPRGGWWAEDGTIVFAPQTRTGLMRISSFGGPVQTLTTLQGSEISHRYPQVLPGGNALLYTASTEVDIGAGATLAVQPLPSGDRIVVQRGGFFGRYTPSGHIVYVENSALFAVPFDRQRLKILGPPRRVVDGVKSDSSRGGAQLAVSETGMLAYLPGQNPFDARPIAWMDRQGTLASLRDVPAHWSNPVFSPDGDRIAVDVRIKGQADIFVYEWARGVDTRVTREGGNDEHPIWTPNGTGIVYGSFTPSSNPPYSLSWKRADGTGDAQILAQSNGVLVPASWHPTQNVLAFVENRPGTGADVMLLRLEGDETSGWKPGQPTALLDSAAQEWEPAFSHDGKWLAYVSDELRREDHYPGRQEVYVRPFPGPGEKVTVSSAGSRPSWSDRTSELVFQALFQDYRRLLWVASYRVEKGRFRPDTPRRWESKGVLLPILSGHTSYALHPDGARVAIPPPPEDEQVEQTHVTLILNFFDHLRHIAPAQH